MNRTQLLVALGALVALLAVGIPGCSGSPLKDPVPKELPRASDNELPRAWDLAEIERATPPYGAGGTVYVLAWKVEEDNRPLRVETCLVLKDLGEDNEHGRWCLAHLYRHPLDKDRTWQCPFWVSPPPPFGPEKPATIDYAKRFKTKPKNKDIYESLKDVQWQFALEKDWKLVGCAVSERTWEAAIGEKPTRFFGP